MVKKIKIEAIIEIVHIDDAKKISPIGEIDVKLLKVKTNDEQKANSLSLDKNILKLNILLMMPIKFILALCQLRIDVAASILKSSSRSSLQDNANFKDKLIQTLTKKFEIDSEYAISLLEQEKERFRNIKK